MPSSAPITSFRENLCYTPHVIRLVWRAAPLWLVGMGFLIVGSSLLPILLLYINKLIIDWLTNNIGNISTDWKLLIGLITLRFILAFGKILFNEIRPFISEILNNRLTLVVTQDLLQQAIRLDLKHYESSNFFTLLSRATQSGSSYPVRVLDYSINILGQTITLLGLVILLVQFNFIILILLLVSFIPILNTGVKFSKQKFKLNLKHTFEGRLASYFQGLLTQQQFAKEVRLFNLGHHFLTRWKETYRQYQKETEAMARHHVGGRFTISLIPTMSFYIAYSWLIFQTVQEQISLGDFVMYVSAFNQAQTLLTGYVQNISSIYDANLYISQYFEFLALKPSILSPVNAHDFPCHIQRGLQLSHVTFSYPDSHIPVLQDINFSVHPGESIAVVGINGSGKTTLVKLLTRLYDVDSGLITIDDIPISAFKLTDVRQNIAVLFQDFSQYKLSILENIGFGDIQNHADRDRIASAAHDAGISDFISELEDRYETKLGNLFPTGRELSGGQWQKIGLARAFMSRAQILILDEPTSAMDAIAEFDLYQRFRQLTQGKITFFISHRFSSVRLADRIMVLDNGRIAELGNHAQLLEKNGLYARMFSLQASGYSKTGLLN
ncbi:MAG: ABC transporter ATP-binding protein [Leptolyngbyaceae bacterium]|nr:ABC transporter ATP-binding protein [Leptolyngbyaceae bacterium]